jgi:hypothetical protein
MGKFDLEFLNADSSGNISYLPFGVTTIEMAPKGEQIEGHIIPEKQSMKDDDQLHTGYADDTKDMLVIWGAGDEEGQVIAPGSTDRCFLNLINLKEVKEKELLTLTNPDFRWKKQVSLTSACNPKEAVKMKFRNIEGNRKQITFEGRKIPLYYPRWFPPRPSEGKRIEYREINYPVLFADFEEKNSSVNSPISISLLENGKKKEICNIEGDLAYSLPHIELFALLPDAGIFVIRVWLYWIHKRFIGNRFYGFENLDISEKRNYRKFEQKLTLEIPDIERFDFVFNSKIGKITWFGTDFHYQEHWGIVKGEVVEARVAGGFDIVGEVLKRIWERQKKSECYDLVEKLEKRQQIEFNQESINLTSIPEMTASEIVTRAYSYRKMFNIRTHVPYVKNGSIDHDMVSNIVSTTLH